MLRQSLVLASLAGLLTCCWSLQADVPSAPDPLRIGVVDSLFRDIPGPIVKVLTAPLGALIREQTGMNGQIVFCGDAYQTARQLEEGKVHLAVFHGIEYAWAKQKHPGLRPLVLAANSHGSMRAHLVVNKDSAVTGFPDLRGKQLALGWPTKEPCRLYLERECCRCASCEAKAFFQKLVTPASVGAALDGVSNQEIVATVVDSFSLKAYENYKPRWAAHVKIVASSEPFPPGVIAYRHGGVPETALKRCRDGLRSAHQTVRGKDMMETWKVTRFETAPADFDRTLAEAMQAFPPPEATVPTKATSESQ